MSVVNAVRPQSSLDEFQSLKLWEVAPTVLPEEEASQEDVGTSQGGRERVGCQSPMNMSQTLLPFNLLIHR